MTDYVGRDAPHPGRMFTGLEDGDSIHGLTDGSWDLIDAIQAAHRLTGVCDLTISTWTAGQADISHAARLLRQGLFRTARWLVDRSFLTRQPAYCAALRERFGDDAIRVWSSHAKFVVLAGGAVDVLYITSANLNRNRRVENFSLFVGGGLPGEYLRLVGDLYRLQRPGEAFDTPAVARPHTAELLRDRPQISPPDQAPDEYADLVPTGPLTLGVFDV